MEQSLPSEQALTATRPWRPGLVFALLLSYYVLFGIVAGALGVLWAEIKLALDLSKAAFGSAQLISPLVSVGLLLAGGYLSARAGKKRLALVSFFALGCALVILASSGSLVGLLCALAVKGVANALLETAANGAMLDWEQATGRSGMNILHAGFSGGAVLGAIGAGLLLSLGWSYPQILLLFLLLSGLMILATLPVLYPPVQPRAAAADRPGTTLGLLFSSRALVVLALLMLLGVVGESVANLWSVIYLRELGAQALVGGAAFALFNGAMFFGRLVNTPLLTRWGARASLLASGVGLIAGTLLLFVPGTTSLMVGLAVVALVLLGLSVAGVIPTALSVAARQMPGDSGAVASALIAMVYVCLVICPPLVGWLADLFSLQVAWVIVGLSGLAIAWLARGVRETRRAA